LNFWCDRLLIVSTYFESNLDMPTSVFQPGLDVNSGA
jgi:hypothetical protein